MKPNDIVTLDIQQLGDDGDGIAQLGRHTVYVSNALPGEKVSASITDVAKTYAHATIRRVLVKSPHRIMPKCPHVLECGGCQILEMNYDEQLRLKRQKVADCLQAAGVDAEDKIPSARRSEMIANYRNKAIYPVSKNADGKIVAGFYRRRSHQIIPSKGCGMGAAVDSKIVAVVINHLNRFNIEPYDEATHTGLVRYILIRTSAGNSHRGITQEVLVSIVINGDSIPHHKELIDNLLAEVRWIKDISITVNCDNTNRIRGSEVITLYGNGYITDLVGDIKFRISPMSFYQINTKQIKVLYDKVLEFAALTGVETVFDLYSGVGTISLYVARHCRKVYGVEIIPQAVSDARQNAAINNIRNVEFIEGKAEEIIPELISKQGVRADVVIVDPPRKGCDKALIDSIIKMRPKRLVYVSCEPKSLARDLRYLQDNGFKTKHVQPVDMFPHTVHVESVALVMA